MVGLTGWFWNCGLRTPILDGMSKQPAVADHDTAERMRRVREFLARTDPELLESLAPADDPRLLHALSLPPRERLRQAWALHESLGRYRRRST